MTSMVWNPTVEAVPGDEPALNRRVWLSHRATSAQLAPEVSLAEQVAAHIELMAREQEPGSRLGSKDELRELVGVSVGTLNEALRIAQARGTVAMRRGPGGGIFSAQTTPLMRFGAQLAAVEANAYTVKDALRMRNALEQLAIEDALENVRATDIDELAGILKNLKLALESGGTERFIRTHWGFQARVTRISPNPLLRTVYTGLIDILDERAVALSPSLGQGKDQLRLLLELDTRMLAALEARDREAALEVVRDYIGSQGPANAA